MKTSQMKIPFEIVKKMLTFAPELGLKVIDTLTFGQLQDWLREKYNLHFIYTVSREKKITVYNYKIVDLSQVEISEYGFGCKTDYYKALTDYFNKCLIYLTIQKDEKISKRTNRQIPRLKKGL